MPEPVGSGPGYFSSGRLLSATRTGLPKDSVANVTQIIALDRSLLVERVGALADQLVEQVLGGINDILDR